MTNTPFLTFSSDQLQSPDFSLKHEWLVTNGIGGYASGTIAGASTRRYHGLLVASRKPPVERCLLLAKLDETLEITDSSGKLWAYPLFSNVWEGATETKGLEILERFSTGRDQCVWEWSPAPGMLLEKRIFMVPGKNTTWILYTLKEAPQNVTAKLRLAPLFAWTDYHHEMQEVGNPPFTWDGETLQVAPNGIQNGPDGRVPITLRSEANAFAHPLEIHFRQAPNWYRGYHHTVEAERGQDFNAALFSPGELTVTLSVEKAAMFAASSEPEPPEYAENLTSESQMLKSEVWKRVTGFDDAGKQLAIAADSFRVTGVDGRKTVIAGYPWFTDWGRDTMISLPGLCLTTGYPEFARQILLSFAESLADGLIPNRFPDAGTTPEYNTADATLWFINALHHYLEATGDKTILEAGTEKSLWLKLGEIIAHHEAGTRHGIRVDPQDGLLFAGEPGIQVTWMDAKVGEWVVTPRIGKPVEICALWINALEILRRLADKRNETGLAAHYTDLVTKAKISFAARFPRPDGFGLYDVLDTPNFHAPDASIRPNQIFALSLPFAPLEAKSPLASFILRTIERELATPYGLRSLSPHDPGYRGRYTGDVMSRDGAYHQGTVWAWLQGSYAEAHYKTYGDKAAARELLRPLTEGLTSFGVGFLPEIYDGDAPYLPNGCFAQAWSVAETLRVWHLLAG